MSNEAVEINFGNLPTMLFRRSAPHSKYFFADQWWIDGEYVHELPVGLTFVSHVRSASLVLDIGANLGWYALLAMRSNPAVPVHCFEMDAVNFRLLTENLELNQASNVTAHQLAVSDCKGVSTYSDTLRQGSDSRSGFHLNSSALSDVDSLCVDTVSLDSQFQSLDGAVIKIDVEGAEQNVLLGARRLLEVSTRVALFIEVHAEISHFGYSSQDLIRFLLQCGCQVSQITNMRSSDCAAVIETVNPTDELPLPQALIYATKGDWCTC
ncbi:hypothetical protein BH10CYA1_BH10CYA1_55780 [soil metagenome]